MGVFSVLQSAVKLGRYRTVAIRMNHRRRRALELAKMFSHKHRDAQKENARLRQELKAEREAAERDALTHLLNRRGFDRRLAELRSYIQRTHKQEQVTATLLIFDLNQVKRINSEYGHAYMDIILEQFAGILTYTFSRKQDIICRQGGDEFAVVLPNTSSEQAYGLAEEVEEWLQSMKATHKAPHFLGVSCGVSEFLISEKEEDFLIAYQLADQAMYAIKNTGRSGVQLTNAA